MRIILRNSFYDTFLGLLERNQEYVIPDRYAEPGKLPTRGLTILEGPNGPSKTADVPEVEEEDEDEQGAIAVGDPVEAPVSKKRAAAAKKKAATATASQKPRKGKGK